MSGSDGNYLGEWVSSTPCKRGSLDKRTVEQIHSDLFQETERSIMDSFANISKAMQELQFQLLLKLKKLQQTQTVLLNTLQPANAPDEFMQNVTKFQRHLEATVTHSDNLSHIKLTLSRLAAILSPDGALHLLVTPLETQYCQEQKRVEYEEQERMGSLYNWDNIRKSFPYCETVGQYHPFSTASLLHQNNEQRENLSPVRQLTASNLNPNLRQYATCFVFYLPPTYTNDNLRTLFQRFGTVLNAYVAMDKATNKSRGFGFVDFSSPSEAQAAVSGLDKYPVEKKFLSVSIKV